MRLLNPAIARPGAKYVLQVCSTLHGRRGRRGGYNAWLLGRLYNDEMAQMELTWRTRSECPDVTAFMEMARRRTGLDDFGDPSLQPALDIFIGAVRDEVWPTMSEAARVQALEYFVHLLATRVRLMADRKAYPEIARQEIRRPLIVVGPPRSGSTLLHTMLTLDPDHLAPEHWSCLEPSPPPALGMPSHERLDASEKRMLAVLAPVPDILVVHAYMIEEGAAALAEDGSDIMNMAFSAQQMWCLYRGETFRRHLLEGDHTAAVRFHHDFLQHLQWGHPGKRWALKGSDHSLRLTELAAQYPDALLIWTHRDLAQQLGSLANIQAILCGVTGNPVSGAARDAVGRLAIEMQRASIKKAMAARDRIGEERFIDVSYNDVMKDPARIVARIYERAGLSMRDEHVAAIETWLRDHPQTKHGVHHYSMVEFGLEAGAINRRFAPYVDRFGFGYGIRPELTV